MNSWKQLETVDSVQENNVPTSIQTFTPPQTAETNFCNRQGNIIRQLRLWSSQWPPVGHSAQAYRLHNKLTSSHEASPIDPQAGSHESTIQPLHGDREQHHTILNHIQAWYVVTGPSES